MVATSLGLLNRDPVANARPVFEGDSATSGLVRHPLFGDTGVFVGRKPLFLATAPTVKQPGRYLKLQSPSKRKGDLCFH